MADTRTITCRRCGWPRTAADFVFVPVKSDAELLNKHSGDRHNPAWRTWEAAMQAGCRTSRMADYQTVDPTFTQPERAES